MNSISPRTNGNQESPDRAPSKRSRVKLNKTSGQTLRQTPGLAVEKPNLMQQVERESAASSKAQMNAEVNSAEEPQRKIEIQLLSTEPQNSEKENGQIDLTEKPKSQTDVAKKNTTANNEATGTKTYPRSHQ